MGASEITAKTNGAEEDTDPMASVAAVVVAAAAVGIAAWGILRMLSFFFKGISRMLSFIFNGISRMFSDNTDSQRKQNAMTFNSSRQLEGMQESYSRPNISRLSPAFISNSGPFVMNTDGACHPNQSPSVSAEDGSVVKKGPSGYGGILRDNRGNWVRGFQGFIRETDCLTAEFHGIHKGLRLLDKLGVVDSILLSDSEAAIDWINSDSNRRVRSQIIIDSSKIIMECKRLKDENRITVGYCLRNSNKCADKLASMAIDNRKAYVEIMNLPDEIKGIVAADQSAMY